MPEGGREKVLILVKALPHVGKKHGETVCCAGVTPAGEWRRLYPIHFRTLRSKFRRWNWVEYDWMRPRLDRRPESRSVQEDSIKISGTLSERQRAAFLDRIIVESAMAASARGKTLALVRPRDLRFSYEPKDAAAISNERAAYVAAASQGSFFDRELKALEPCPYRFRFRYRTDDGGAHHSTCDDWETAAMFYNFKKRYGIQGALDRMSMTFNDVYAEQGVTFALGTHSRRPNIWLLVGVIKAPEVPQLSMTL